MIRIARTLPPAAAPIPFTTLLGALPACFDNSGRASTRFEKEIREYFESKYCFLLSSGKAALALILTSLKELYPDRDEVLVLPFTCYSVPAAIQRAGLRIKLCDMGPSSLDFDRKQLEEMVSIDRDRKTILCVLVTHLFGYPADIREIRKIVGNDIPIVEDAAQAMGGELDGQRLGNLADVGFFSLGRGKALSTLAGGVIIAGQERLGAVLAERVSSLPENTIADKLTRIVQAILISVLQQPNVFWLPKALPFLRLGETLYEEDFSISRLSSVQAAFGRNWQQRLSRHQEARRKNIEFWGNVLPEKCIPWVRAQSPLDVDLIRFPLLAPSSEEREEILKFSESMGLGIMASYPKPIHLIAELAGFFQSSSFPVAEDICSRLLTLPVHEYVSTEDNRKILHILSRHDLVRAGVNTC